MITKEATQPVMMCGLILNQTSFAIGNPSGICAKLHTVAASNNGDHAPQSLLLLLVRATYIYVVLSAHTVRGELHIQRNATGEVAKPR